MSIKEVKIKHKWKFESIPLIKIDHCVVDGFIKQYIFNLSLFKDLFWIELDFANHLTSLKIGILSVYFVIGGGTNE